jgi:DnaJ-class molecular chaperone
LNKFKEHVNNHPEVYENLKASVGDMGRKDSQEEVHLKEDNV